MAKTTSYYSVPRRWGVLSKMYHTGIHIAPMDSHCPKAGGVKSSTFNSQYSAAVLYE